MTAVCEGWWHPNVKSGQVHDHPEHPKGNWSVASHRLCERVYTRRSDVDLLDRVKAICSLHVKDAGVGGMTSGACKECGLGWPCPTTHSANGWGEMHDCWDAGWCAHAGVPVRADEAGYV